MEINIENCRTILEKNKKLSSEKFDEKLASSKSKGRKFSKTEADVVFNSSAKKYRKMFGEVKFDDRSKGMFFRWLNGKDHSESFVAKRLDGMSMTLPSRTSSQMSVDDVESEEEMLKRENSELKEQLRLAREHIDRQAKKTDLFKVERHPTRANGSGSCEKFGLKLTAVVHESLAQGVSGNDIRRVLEAVGNHCDLFGPDSRLPSESWITKCRLDLPTFNARQIKDFVVDSEHLVLGTDDTSLGQLKVASYGLHNHRGDYL